MMKSVVSRREISYDRFWNIGFDFWQNGSMFALVFCHNHQVSDFEI